MEEIFGKLAKREGSRILALLWRFSSSKKIEDAIAAQDDKFVQLLSIAAMTFERRFKDETGRDFDDVPEEVLGELGRRLGSAFYDARVEEDEERLKILAAGVFGTLGAAKTKEERAEIWRTIRQLGVADVRALVEHGYAYLKAKKVGVKKLETNEFKALVDLSTNERLQALRCVRIEQKGTVNLVGNTRSSSQPVNVEGRVLLLPHGERVLDALVPYLVAQATPMRDDDAGTSGPPL